MLHIHKGPASVIVVNGKSHAEEYMAALTSAHTLMLKAAMDALKDDDVVLSNLYVTQAARLWNLRGAFENLG